MKLVQAGETAHLAVLFERHHVALFRYLLGLTGNRAISEDLVQDVFFRVIKHARSFDGRYSFSVWIHSMARNAYIDLYRKRRREVPDDLLSETRSHEPLAEEIIGRDQNLQFLREALDSLPEEKREVLILSRFQNLQYDEISRIMGCEVGTVKTRVFRALQELRRLFCELQKEKTYDL